ncbi:MAG: DNA recombination protein RmuC [Candidatus Poseidoniaceae archaeon]|nr:DNA recombination protein RmuC [Candidatus Poseidoniaceae archaeon]
MEVLYFSGATVVIVLIVWYAMNQRMNKLLMESQLEASIKLASYEAKETSLTDSVQEYETSMKDSFKILAQDAFEEAMKKADAEKESSFQGATKELQDKLHLFNENINRFERESIQRDTNLKNEISTVANLGIQLSEDTKSLTNALKADAQAQGAWGELVLENLLQSMGFKEGRDYVAQLGETSADGKRKRTDFIIYLPDNRQVIIDSKVSLKAWNAFVNAQSDDEADKALKEHCESISSHAKKLASKRYQDMESINSVEFVLMFVPLESAFGAAMRQSPELYMDLAGNINVKVVTGATIVTALLLIKDMWKRELQSKNQVRLVDEAGKLHDKIVLFLESFTQLGFEIKQTNEAYEEAMNRLSTGTGNVIKRTDDLKKLGAKVKKEINTKLLEESTHSHNTQED